MSNACTLDHINTLPQFVISAVDYPHLGSSAVVLPLSYVPEFVYIALPKVLTQDADFIGATEIGPMPGAETEVSSLIHREDSSPWLVVPSSAFGKIPGLQSYRLSFQEKELGRTFDLYFSVIVQNDNPDKPYIYMNRESTNVQSN